MEMPYSQTIHCKKDFPQLNFSPVMFEKNTNISLLGFLKKMDFKVINFVFLNKSPVYTSQ